VQSFIGLVMLAGIVVNNAIVLIDYMIQLKRRDPERSGMEIVKEASIRRFRPILMTTLTTVLAMLPVAALAVAVTVWETWSSDRMDRRRCLRVASIGAGVALATFIALCLTVFWQADLNLLKVWLANFHNHARFYEQFPRTWWKWLLVNPLELSVAIGPPIMVLAISGLLAWRHFTWKQRSAVAGLVIWFFLWLSGKNSGEAARLWIFLMPWWCWIAGLALERLLRESAKLPLLGVACQLLASAIVATGVSGFLTS